MDAPVVRHEEPEPAIVLEGVWKRYRRVRRLNAAPVPFVGGRDLRPDRDARKGDDGGDDIDDDMEEDDEEAVEGGPRIVTALRDVSLTVGTGRSLGILGANGSGKTTLLKLLARLSPPTEGRIVVRGRVSPVLELATAMMDADASGRRNVLIVSDLFGVPREIADRRMSDIMEFAGVQGHEDAQVKTYSSGMLRRLAFSISLNLEPDILLVDEIIGVGDSKFSRSCFAAVQAARRNGLTVVYASHDLEAVATLCDEAALLENGAIVAHGPVGDVIGEYERAQGTRPTARAGSRPAGAWDPVDPRLLRKPGPHADEHARMLSAGIFAMDGEPIEMLRTDEEGIVEILFEAFDAVPAIRCTVQFSVHGARRLRAVQDEPVGVDRPGVYVVSMHLPAGMLRDGEHEARVGVRMHVGGEWTTLILRRAFTLDVQSADAADDDIDALGDDTLDIAGDEDSPPLSWAISRVS
jgi:lipopolysaccharide transport system ATP-binding protein